MNPSEFYVVLEKSSFANRMQCKCMQDAVVNTARAVTSVVRHSSLERKAKSSMPSAAAAQAGTLHKLDLC